MKYLSRTPSPSSQRLIAGVCDGIGETYQIDPRVVRLACIFMAITPLVFPLLVTYGVAWLILPERLDS